MGLIGRVLNAGGVVRETGKAVGGVAEVFVGNRAAREAAAHAQVVASLTQYGAEFAQAKSGWFDRFMNGLNRLPRPILVIGTIGLFVFAMVEPSGFSRRMEGLRLVPDPMWWLLGAIVSFYFGARELHYQRGSGPAPVVVLPTADGTKAPLDRDPSDVPPSPPEAAAHARLESTTEQRGNAAGAEAGAASDYAEDDDQIDTRPTAGTNVPGLVSAPPRMGVMVRASDAQFNAALEEWRLTRRA